MTTRRGLIGWLLGSGLAVSVSSFLYPVLKFVLPPEIAEAAVNEATVGKVGEFKLNTAKIVKFGDRKSTRLNSSHIQKSRMPSSA